MNQPNLEERVGVLEQTVARLVVAQNRSAPKRDWRSTIGMFEGDPVIREIQEEGRKIREADRQAAIFLPCIFLPKKDIGQENEGQEDHAARP